MKLRTIALGGVAATVAGYVLWRRRKGEQDPAPAHIGLSDGTSEALNAADPAVAELRGLAADLRRSLEVGG